MVKKEGRKLGVLFTLVAIFVLVNTAFMFAYVFSEKVSVHEEVSGKINLVEKESPAIRKVEEKVEGKFELIKHSSGSKNDDDDDSSDEEDDSNDENDDLGNEQEKNNNEEIPESVEGKDLEFDFGFGGFG